jgi:hypothetical protein
MLHLITWERKSCGPRWDETVPLLAPIISGKKPVFKHLPGDEP